MQLKQILARLYILYLQPVCFTSGPWWEFRGSFVWPQDGQLEVKWANKHLPDSQVACLRDTFSNLLSCTLGDFQTKVIVVLCSQLSKASLTRPGRYGNACPVCIFFLKIKREKLQQAKNWNLDLLHFEVPGDLFVCRMGL